MTKIVRISVSCAILTSLALSGCSSENIRPPINTTATRDTTHAAVEKRQLLQSVADQYSCDVHKNQDIYLYAQSFLRASTGSFLVALNDTAYRNAIIKNEGTTKKYISPKYLRKYYIDPDTVIIDDSYDFSRPEHIICVRSSVDGNYTVYVFSYSRKYMDYPAVDTITVTNVNGKNYILPLTPPKQVSAESSLNYVDIGVPNVPTTAISVTNAVYKAHKLYEPHK